MKYMILKGKSHIGKYRYNVVGKIEASSLEIASDLVYKKFREEVNKKNGETYIIIPDSQNTDINSIYILPLDDVPYNMIKYWEPGEGLP
ncbi:hypothetical protein COJ85_01745 [Bacillus sp. AFS076308]|uniref:hypothetical protein n=1 Tax=unclassified Bacillus (in: firmicutes) TaxID=185979 RepID=UPI000BF2AC8A|nr:MULTISPECIES: hypothetical protein [unclassified Bacillus (in: firmicutes)]PFO09353.1 hypothetical protein COJ85_01745 [Bacillus sp. AFS076308]PGV50331.1 hypothetical protein COD92_18330 [Bacillus sp. AFS037270]